MLILFARGYEKPAIAKRLGISPNTVRNTVSATLRKLRAGNIRHAVALALLNGEISAVDLIFDLPALITERKPKRQRQGRKGAGMVAAPPLSAT